MARRPIVNTLLLWCLTGCSTWRVQNLTPQQVIDRWHPASVRITTTHSSQFVLKQPRIAAGDSLVGQAAGVPDGVAISDVTHVAIRRFSARKTLGLILLIRGVLGIMAAGRGTTAGSSDGLQ
jgi:hypothetical protein